MKQNNEISAKKLRHYLRSFSGCQLQAKEIGVAVAEGGIVESVADELLKSKKEFERQCCNVQRIIGLLDRDSLESRILWKLYIYNQPMADIARQLGYSYGHCANTEAAAIKRLCATDLVKRLLL